MKKLFVLLMIVTSMLLLFSCATLELERIPEKFAITKTILCTEYPGGYQKYIENTTKQQPKCKPMYIYFEFENLTTEIDENGEHIWLELSSRILDVKGTVVYQEPPITPKFYLQERADPRWICYRNYPQNPRLNLQPGDYTFQFVIVDMYTEKGDSAKLNFTIIPCSKSI